MLRIGLIDYYLDEWHANHYPAWIREASGDGMAVTHAYAQADSPVGGRTTAQWCREMGIAQVDTIEAVTAACDGLIVLSPDHCERHEALCQIPLRSGKPVYVDKTFAPDAATARRLFALASEHGTPCYSASALRYAAEYGAVDRDQVLSLCSWGPGALDGYGVHQLEPMLMLMQAPVRRVMALPGSGWVSLSMEFADGRCATLACYQAGAPYMMNLCMGEENRVIEVTSDFFGCFIKEMVAFFQTRQVPVPPVETLRIMAAREAGMKALQAPFTWAATDAEVSF